MDTNRKNELAESVAEKIVASLDNEGLENLAIQMLTDQYKNTNDSDLVEVCNDLGIETLQEYNLSYYESEEHNQAHDGSLPDEYRQYWSCWAEDYEHAVEQLLDAEPEACYIDLAD